MDNVIWTDEKIFVVGKLRRMLWRRSNGVFPTYCHFKVPYKITIFGGISKRGKTTLRFTKKTINSDV